VAEARGMSPTQAQGTLIAFTHPLPLILSQLRAQLTKSSPSAFLPTTQPETPRGISLIVESEGEVGDTWVDIMQGTYARYAGSADTSKDKSYSEW
jgi:hypothetical protein